MDEKQLRQLEEHLEIVVKKTVNREIIRCKDKILEKLAEQKTEHEEDMKGLKPIIEAYSTANNSGKFVVWISKITIAIGIIVAGVFSLIKFLK